MEKKGAFDYILLETTGLADPGNIAPLFWVDDGLGSTIYLDGIVTLVDAKNVLRSLDDPAGKVEGHEDSGEHGPLMTTAHVQISHADVVVINKSDLVTQDELQQVKERISSINGLAKLHVTEKSVVPQLEGFLLDLHAYDQFDEAEQRFKGHSHLDPVSAAHIRRRVLSNVCADTEHRRYLRFRFRSHGYDGIRLMKWTSGCGRSSGRADYQVTKKPLPLRCIAPRVELY